MPPKGSPTSTAILVQNNKRRNLFDLKLSKRRRSVIVTQERAQLSLLSKANFLTAIIVSKILRFRVGRVSRDKVERRHSYPRIS